MTSTNESTSSLVWYPGHVLQLTDIIRAENCTLHAADGTRYVDLESGVWCTSIGHAHPRVSRVIAEQVGRIGHTGYIYSHAIVEEAARDVLSLCGFDGGRCVFLCSGSEAVEFAVRAAQSINERDLLMTMNDSYFGAYGSASQRRSEEWFCFDWTACPGGACHERCEHWSTIPFDRIGGFLFEPGSSSGMVRFPPAGLIRAIVEQVRANDGIVLINEVTTGVGRTGRWFGYQHYDIEPDIVALGKGIGNGYPVSVTAFAPGVVERLGERPVPYAQSHQNDPLAAAVAREVIRVIREEDLIERGREIGAALIAGLERIRDRSDRILEIRGRGLMVAVELRDDDDGAITARVQRALVDHGYIVARRPASRVLRIDPSLTIDRGDIGGFLAAFESVLSD